MIDPALIPGDDLLEFAAQFGGWWASHPKFIRPNWQSLVATGDTSLGYWQWVAECVNDIDSDL